MRCGRTPSGLVFSPGAATSGDAHPPATVGDGLRPREARFRCALWEALLGPARHDGGRQGTVRTRAAWLPLRSAGALPPLVPGRCCPAADRALEGDGLRVLSPAWPKLQNSATLQHSSSPDIVLQPAAVGVVKAGTQPAMLLTALSVPLCHPFRQCASGPEDVRSSTVAAYRPYVRTLLAAWARTPLSPSSTTVGSSGRDGNKAFLYGFTPDAPRATRMLRDTAQGGHVLQPGRGRKPRLDCPGP